MEFMKHVLVIMCVFFMSSTCISAVLIPSDECHVLDSNAPRPIQKGRIRIFEVDVFPVRNIPGVRLNVKFNAFRNGIQLSDRPGENARVHMTLTWKGSQGTQTVTGEIKPSEYSDDYPVLCKHVTSPSCPIAARGEFSAAFTIHVPFDVLLNDMWLKIEMRNNRNQLLGCYRAHVQSAFNV
ncbi:hypothetical protein RND81_04G115200 [Saponaria officinalis]|uniref:MD-2-related lipid-recognition domain-containing protein n=1 Tax=Saponaria officinalis TaxID=3572 RepID=A0AAW1LIH9_SAPOF